MASDICRALVGGGLLEEGAERSDGAVMTGRPGRWSSSKSLSGLSPAAGVSPRGAAADARYGPANCRIIFAALIERPRHCISRRLRETLSCDAPGLIGPDARGVAVFEVEQGATGANGANGSSTSTGPFRSDEALMGGSGSWAGSRAGSRSGSRPTSPRGNGTLTEVAGRASHSFHDCSLIVCQCTRTTSPHPPRWSYLHGVPFSAEFEQLLVIQL